VFAANKLVYLLTYLLTIWFIFKQVRLQGKQLSDGVVSCAIKQNKCCHKMNLLSRFTVPLDLSAIKSNKCCNEKNAFFFLCRCGYMCKK